MHDWGRGERLRQGGRGAGYLGNSFLVLVGVSSWRSVVQFLKNIATLSWVSTSHGTKLTKHAISPGFNYVPAIRCWRQRSSIVSALLLCFCFALHPLVAMERLCWVGTGTPGIPQWCREVTCMRYQLAVQNSVYLQNGCVRNTHIQNKSIFLEYIQ